MIASAGAWNDLSARKTADRKILLDRDSANVKKDRPLECKAELLVARFLARSEEIDIHAARPKRHVFETVKLEFLFQRRRGDHDRVRGRVERSERAEDRGSGDPSRPRLGQRKERPAARVQGRASRSPFSRPERRDRHPRRATKAPRF